MRSVRTKGKKKGQPTKSSNKGKPWSDLWKKEMARCTGPGAWAESGDVDEEWEEDGSEADEQNDQDATLQKRDDDDVEESKLKCSPVTVIYGHAGASTNTAHRRLKLMASAGRGLDIKPFSKGIDTGCVVSRFRTPVLPL